MYDRLKDAETVEKTIAALQSNGITACFVESGEAAKQTVLALIPKGAEVMTMTSMTLQAVGLAQEFNDSGQYDSVRNKLLSLNRETQGADMQKIGAAPVWAVGSVHAVTENGEVLIASNTGSQLAAYAYGAQHVIWVVGTQKIVKSREEALKRIYEYALPLENARAQNAYGIGSNVSKLLMINKEIKPHRLTIVFVNEKLGF
jgi:L-lactate utilization protein LutB